MSPALIVILAWLAIACLLADRVVRDAFAVRGSSPLRSALASLATTALIVAAVAYITTRS